MQPTENKQPAQEELIAHVRKTLKAHQEPYNLGAWESFNAKKQTKRTPIFWMIRLGGVAAVIAVFFTLSLLTKTKKEHETNDFVKVNSNQIEFKGNETALKDQTEVIAKISLKQLATTANNSVIKHTEVLVANETMLSNTQQNEQSIYQAQNRDVIEQNSAQKIAATTEVEIKPNIIDFLIKETKENESAPQRITKNSGKRKWVLGLMVAPSLGNAEELNMGYGISMGYNFSEKLSLVTGVSYNEMSASKDFTGNMGMSSILYGNNKSLAAISQKVTGLDIPLELKYSFNKNVYASLGVSAFAVIGQSRSNTFIQGVVVNGAGNNTTSSSGLNSGTSNNPDLSGAKGQFANTYILNKKIVERANLEDQNNVNYLGFYNFSFGYKKKMLKNHFVAFEPFVKLPINNVTQDNLKLVGAGLRLKVDF